MLDLPRQGGLDMLAEQFESVTGAEERGCRGTAEDVSRTRLQRGQPASVQAHSHRVDGRAALATFVQGLHEPHREHTRLAALGEHGARMRMRSRVSWASVATNT